MVDAHQEELAGGRQRFQRRMSADGDRIKDL